MSFKKCLPGHIKGLVARAYGSGSGFLMEHGKTLKEELGMPESTVRRIMNGSRKFRNRKEAAVFARLLGVKISGLFADGVEPDWDVVEKPWEVKVRRVQNLARFRKSHGLPWVKALIDEKFPNISTEAVADMFDCTNSMLAKRLNGTRRLTSVEARVFARVLGTTPEFIKKGPEKTVEKPKPLIDILAPEPPSEARLVALEASNAEIRAYIKELKASQEEVKSDVSTIQDSLDQLLGGNKATEKTLDSIKKTLSRLMVEWSGKDEKQEVSLRIDPVPGAQLYAGGNGRAVNESVQGA